MRFRTGGRATPQQSAGTFPTRELAERRAEEIRMRLAGCTLNAAAYRRPRKRPGNATATVYVARAANGAVLYVGITCRDLQRLHSHAGTSAWWAKTATIELEHFKTRRQAEERERALIIELQPPFNVVHIAAGAA